MLKSASALSGEWEDDGAGGIRAVQANANGTTATLTDTAGLYLNAEEDKGEDIKFSVSSTDGTTTAKLFGDKYGAGTTRHLDGGSATSFNLIKSRGRRCPFG